MLTFVCAGLCMCEKGVKMKPFSASNLLTSSPSKDFHTSTSMKRSYNDKLEFHCNRMWVENLLLPLIFFLPPVGSKSTIEIVHLPH